MLISDKNKFIFVHIRKSAGTSIRKIIEPLCIRRSKDFLTKIKSQCRLEKDYHKFYFRAHGEIMVVKEIMPPEIFDSYFKFSFVRNPWARLVSEYEYIRREKTHGRHGKVIKMDFKNYIKYQAKRFDAHQINMLADRKGALLMDFIGKLENLNDDWHHVCKQIDIPFSPLPHENRTKKKDFRSYYSDNEKSMVENLWKRDIETFGYRFEDGIG